MAPHPRELTPARSARDLYGAELRRQRQLAGLSLDRLSDIVNYSKTHLHAVEFAERLPLPPLSAKLDLSFGTGELRLSPRESATLIEATMEKYPRCEPPRT